MISLKSIIYTIIITTFITGCAGTNFIRVNDDSLKLGKTTEQEIRSQMGAPYREGVVTKNEQQLTTLNYAYASTGGDSLYESVTPARSQAFIFHNNVLVGHEFSSSWKSDNTEFNNENISKLKENKSTRPDVLKTMGKPTIHYIYPVSENKNGETLGYLYSHTTGSAFNLKFYNKMLLVELSDKGVVTKVNYTSSGQK